MRRWGERIKSALISLGIGGLVLGFLLGVGALAFFAPLFPEWTGFAADPLPASVLPTPVVVYQQEKTLWDWLQLLLVPLVLAIGGYWLTRTENRYALELQERRERNAQELEDQRIVEARRIEEERAQDAALQAYLDQMSQLLLHENLLSSQPEDVVRTVARARTLTVLKQLDSSRKGRVVQFLGESGLSVADSYKEVVVSLEGSNLQEVEAWAGNLRGANLARANLERAKLVGATITGANLSNTILKDAVLFGADLRGSTLRGANLTKANLQQAQLQGVELLDARLDEASLKGANLESARLNSASLKGVDLSYAILEGAFLRGVDLTDAILVDANILRADLSTARLSGASLQRADLQRADLTFVNLRGANLTDANLSGATFDNAIGLPEHLRPQPSSAPTPAPADSLDTDPPVSASPDGSTPPRSRNTD